MSDISDKLKAAAAKLAEFKPRPGLLLHPQIPKPMHGLAPRVVLGQEWWDKTRKEAQESTGFRCLACGVTKWLAAVVKHLEGHEVYGIDYPKGRMTYVETVPLCYSCHNFIHAGRMEMLVASGEMDRQEMDRILKHGYAALKAAGLKRRRKAMLPERVAPWSQWRLVVFGVEYLPLYSSFDDWKRNYARS